MKRECECKERPSQRRKEALSWDGKKKKIMNQWCDSSVSESSENSPTLNVEGCECVIHKTVSTTNPMTLPS